MEISLLKSLLNSITAFLDSSPGDEDAEPVEMNFQKIEEMLKLLKPVLDAIVDSDIVSDKLLSKVFEELGQSIDELRDLFTTCHPLKSKIFFVIQTDQLISKLRASGLRFFKLLESLQSSLPDELSSGSLEHCIQKITHMGYEQSSTIIKGALRKKAEGEGPSSETLIKVEDYLNLKTNQALLIEAVALEHLKENAEQAESVEEVEYIDQMIALVTLMHDRYISVKQSQSSSLVSIPPDFCCPLSLELMTDPVIVASGQTYERAYIKNWIDLGLTVCPKTRQTLAHTNLIPNYTVKALIANWCENNNVKLPDHVTTLLPVHFSPLHPHADSGVARGNQPSSPESIRSTGLPADGFISSGANHMQGTSPIHPRSSSGGSGMTANMNGLEIGRLSQVSSEDRVVNREQHNAVSIGQPSFLPRRDYSNSILGAGQLSHSHNQSASESSSHSSEFPQGISGDVNETVQELGRSSAYNSDASGEMAAEPPAASTMTTQQRESDFPSRMETRPRNQTFWRRPSERFVPRIVPSPPAENRPDLLEIETQVRKLVKDLESNSLDDQREATAQLRLLARNNMDNRIIIANSGAISLLVSLLRSTDTRTQENAVTALLNLSINDNNKAAIANADAIDPLIHVLKTGSSEAKENSAATLFSLSVMEENKIKIGRSGAIRPLVDLLGNGTPRGKKDAATALFNLSIFHENKTHIVQAGAVRYLVDLMDPAAGMVDKAVAVLANLATIPEGRTEIGQEGGIRVLVEVVELGSARGKENAAAALLQLCTNSSRYCSMVLQEGAVPPLVALSQSGTPRAKEKAQALLSYFRNNRHGGAGRA